MECKWSKKVSIDIVPRTNFAFSIQNTNFKKTLTEQHKISVKVDKLPKKIIN